MISIVCCNWHAKIAQSRRYRSSSARSSYSSTVEGPGTRLGAPLKAPMLSSILACLPALTLVLAAVTSRLLLLSGDVEQNPGPSKDDKPELYQLQCMCYTNKEGDTVDVRLVDRIQPKWYEFAVALRFQLHRIQSIKREDNPVVSLLIEWLLGGNMTEDRRPVTWATFIEALHHAGLKEEANIMQFITSDHKKVDTQEEFSTSRPRGFVLIRHLSGGYTMRHGSIEVYIEPDVPSALKSLLEEYADMLMVLRLTKPRKTTLTRLITFISDFSDESSIRECSSLSDAINILTEKLKIYIFNIDILSASYKHFDRPAMKASVRKYKRHLNEFLSNTSVKEFMGCLQTKITDHSIVEPITLKLDESRTDCTLKALKTLIYHFFGNCSKALAHCDTGPGCVSITMLVPASLVPTFKSMAEQLSCEYFASQGGLELVAGLRITVKDFILECSNAKNQRKELENELRTVQKEFSKLQREVELLLSNVSVGDTAGEEYLAERISAYLNSAKMKERARLNMSRELNIMYNKLSAFKVKNEELEKVLKFVKKERSDYQEECEKLKEELKKVKQQSYEFEVKSEELQREVDMFQQKESCKTDVQAGTQSTSEDSKTDVQAGTQSTSEDEYTDESSSSLSLQSMEDSRPLADFSKVCAPSEEIKCTLNYSSYTKLQECNESVGPSEELDEDFKPHYDSVKAYVTSSVGTIDYVPQQLYIKLDHVQSLAKSVNTNVYRAADILETLNSAFVYGRSACSDPFQLEVATRESLNSFDASFKKFLEGRVNAEFDQADQELTKCKQSAEKAVHLARRECARLREREKVEDREVTMSDLDTTHNEAIEGIREDKTELEEVARCCASDITKIDESLHKRKVLWGRALVDYTNERTERESELASNRSRQHQLEQELRPLKEREYVLVRLSKNRAGEQARSNMEYERVVKEIADWKEQIETLYQQAQASLKIVDTMSECTSLVMEDAKWRKREWNIKLSNNELETLLQLRDALMAHASIHLMESDDCKSTITTIRRDIVTAKEEKSKHSKMGYKEGLQEAKAKVKSLEDRLQVYHSKMEEHDRKVATVQSELKDTDELIHKL